MENLNKTKIIILAAGKGKRMETDSPKVLAEINGKIMIKYLLESVKNSGILGKPCIIVGYQKEKVVEALGSNYDYAIQNEQLGTGHAVSCAEEYTKDASDVLILFGDQPFVKPETIKKMVTEHIKYKNKITMATVVLPDFLDYRAFFYHNFSRIVRDDKGNILKSVEFKDATEEEKKILEVNPCYFIFDAKWLWENLKKIKNENIQKEYYLTDLLKIANEEGEKIESIQIDPPEALGANSKEELEILEKFARLKD